MLSLFSISRTPTLYLGLFISYFATGHLLSNLAFQAQVVPIWLPAGIALVGSYLWGVKFLPAVFIASFLFNYSVHPVITIDTFWSTSGIEIIIIASGAMLQASVGSWLLRNWLGNPLRYHANYKSVFFIFVVGILVNTISATIGISALSFFNPNYSQQYFWHNFIYWWLGDSLGVLLFTPFFLSLMHFTRSRHPQQRSKLTIMSTALFLFIMVSSFTYLFLGFSAQQNKGATQREIKIVENGLYRELNNSLAQLQNLASFIQSNKLVSHYDFKYFVMELMKTQPTIKAMSWNPLIQQQDIAVHNEALYALYGKNVQIKGEPLKADDPVVYVQYIHPERANENALGFNVYSNPERKSALITAAKEFLPKATPIIQLVQSKEQQPAYLLFFPVFEYNENSGNRQLLGYATGVFLAKKMIENALSKEATKLFSYEVYDINNEQVFASNTKKEEISLTAKPNVERLDFTLAGQQWRMNLMPNTQYIIQQKSKSYLPLFILQVGIVVFVMLFMLLMHNRQLILERLIDKRTKSLKLAMQEANNANLAKSRFLANMSHEIRIPMNAVVGFARLAKFSDDCVEVKDYLNKIEVSSDMLLNIVNDILDISKIESEKLILADDVFDIHSSLARLDTIFSSAAKEKGLTWQLIDRLPDTIYYVGDQTRVEQILMNLCSNALKFTQEGGVSLTARIKEEKSHGNVLELVVKDSGIGIAAASQHKLFQPFAQEDDTTSRHYGGTGLGLAISRELSQLMAGDIVLNSEQGVGSEFIVTLFLKTTHEKPHFHRSPPSKDISHLRILVAEDNRINQLLITKILTNMGIKPCVVDNGQQAVEKVLEQEFDAILMDCQMPLLDGYEATAQIRQLPQGKSLAIYALTADVNVESKAKGVEAGFDDHLAKPINVTLLTETLQKVKSA